MMKRLRKRIVSLMIALVMAFSLLPASAWATPVNRTQQEWEQSQYGQQLIEEGYTYGYAYVLEGTDIIYALFEKRDYETQSTLTAYIFALAAGGVQSDMPDYHSAGETPWHESKLDRLYLEEGITGIGNYAFADQVNLTAVTLPETVTEIGDSAFANDRQLAVRVDAGSAQVMDLSNVTHIGKSAFANCTSLGGGGATQLKLGSKLTEIGDSAFSYAGIRNVTFAPLEESITLTIGQNAFSHSGIEKITLPEGLTSIGAYAFAYNSLTGSLSIPDSVAEIGDYAFFVSSDAKNETLAELTLGKNLENVGESAFRNYMALSTVNIRTTNPNLQLGQYAFGHDRSDAYSTNREIDGQNYYVGADFKIVDETAPPEVQDQVLAAFVNGTNCYLGAMSPLKLTETVDPTCLSDGRYTYEFKLEMGEQHFETKKLYETIPHLEHNYVSADPNTIDPSCEQPGGTLMMCQNAEALKGQTVTDTAGRKVTVLENGYHYNFNPDATGAPPKGHNYQPVEAENPTIDGNAASGTTTLTYACQTEGHTSAGEDFNSYGGVLTPDRKPEQVSIALNWKKLNVTTMTTLGEIETQLNGMVANGAGTLSIVYGMDQTKDSKLPAGDAELELLFTPDSAYTANYPGMAAAGSFGGSPLKLHVTVQRVALDFTRVFFKDAGTTVSETQPPKNTTILEPASVPTEVSDGPAFFYCQSGSEDWQSTPPDRREASTWKVKAVFQIDTKFYQVTDTAHAGAGAGYEIDYDDAAGTVTITAPYVIAPAKMSSITATGMDGVYGDESAEQRIRISNVPGSSEVYFTVTKDGVPGAEQGPVFTPHEGAENFGGMFIGNIPEAGEYSVSIRVKNTSGVYSPEEYTLAPVTFTVAKKEIAVPTGNHLTYDPATEQQQGVPAGTGYTLGGDCYAADAGTYVGTVTLADPSNTKWKGSDGSSVKVVYTIAPQKVMEPRMSTGFKWENTYDGKERTAVQAPQQDGFTYKYENGELVAYYKSDYEVFTVTDAKRTDAGSYHTQAKLNNPAGKQNYVWFTTESSEAIDVVESWYIAPAQVALPDITVNQNDSVPYTGRQVDETLIRFDGQTKEDYTLTVAGGYTLTADHYTWLKDSGVISAPTDVGRYQLQVTFALSNGAKTGNYTFDGSAGSGGGITKTVTVNITKAQLGLTGGETITTPYTGSPIAIPQVTIAPDSLVGDDQAEDIPMSYTYTLSGEEETVTESTAPTFIERGTYAVAVQPASNSNYTAAPVTVTLTIEQAEQQVALTPEDGTDLTGTGTPEEPYQVTKELTDESFYVTGKGYVADDTPEGHPTGADTTYEVKNPDGHTVAEVAQNGTVTIKGAGTATITITAPADKDGGDASNYTAGSTSYRLTVQKGTPVIDLTGYADGAFTTPYAGGQPVTGYEKATASGVTGIGLKNGLTYTFYTDANCQHKLDTGNGGNVPTQVGEYYLKVTYDGTDDPNYKNVTDTKPIHVRITPAAVGTVTHKNYTGKLYTGESISLKGLGATVAGFETADYDIFYLKTESGESPDAAHPGWTEDVTVKNVADSTGDTAHYWYKVVIKGGNYAPSIGEIAVGIEPAELTVQNVPDSYTKPYDGTNTVTASLDEIAVTAAGVTGETVTISDRAGAYDSKTAQTEKDVTLFLTLSGAADWGNYSYNGEPLTEGKLTVKKTDAGAISPKVIAVIGGVTAEDKVYDGENTVALTGVPATEEGAFVAGDTVSFNAVGALKGYTANADAEDGKQVTVRANDLKGLLDGADAGNYTVEEPYTTTADISQRTVTLAFDGIQEGVIEKPYTGSPVDVLVQPVDDQGENAGFVPADGVGLNQDDVKYTYTGEDESHAAVGDYTVSAALKEETAATYRNYTLVFPEAATLRVTPVGAVSVTEKDYKGDYTGQPHDVTRDWAFAGYAGDASRVVEFIKQADGDEKNPGEEADDWQEMTFQNVSQTGDYWYRVTAPNHQTVYGKEPVHIEIRALDLTVTPNGDKGKEYDGLNGFDVGKITDTAVTGTVREESIEATPVSGTYDNHSAGENKTISILYTLTGEGGTDLSNYTFGGAPIPADGRVTVSMSGGEITARKITITIANKEKIYDGTLPTVGSEEGADWKVTAGELVQGDSLGVALTVNNAKAGADAYTISGKAANPNYDVVFENGIYTVAHRPITVQIGNAGGLYGEQPDLAIGEQKVTLTDVTEAGTEAGFVDSDLYSALPGLALTSTASETAPAGGSYQIQATNGKYGNYDVTFRDGTYTVNKRPITITLNNQESTYGEQPVVDQSAFTVTQGSNAVVEADLKDGLKVSLTVYENGTEPIHAASPVGNYDILPEVSGAKNSNYTITWTGEGTEIPTGGRYGKYEIQRAALNIAYPGSTHSVSMGSVVDYPLQFASSSGNLPAKPSDVTVEYASSHPQFAAVDPQTGAITLIAPGTTTITAKVMDYGANYQGESNQTASYELTVVQGGTGIQVNVQPRSPLVYTGGPLELVTVTKHSPEDVTMQYKLGENGHWQDTIPTAVNHGTYTVFWKASAAGFTAIEDQVQVTIAKADPSKGFTEAFISVAYQETAFDSTGKTQLQIHPKYETEEGANITYKSDDTTVAKVMGNDLKTIELYKQGSVTITAQFEETANFTEQSVSFRLEVTASSQEIQVSYAAEVAIPYDGASHGLSGIVVSGPAQYTIMYSDDEGESYSLPECPETVTNVADGKITIYFQVQADGYNSAKGKQTVSIAPKDIETCKPDGISDLYTYTGVQITFDESIQITNGTTLLLQGTDYQVDYGTNTDVGYSPNDQDLNQGGGWVRVAGIGNYTGAITKYFEIKPVEGFLSAQLDRYFGYYGDEDTNHTVVTVMHGGHPVDAGEITIGVSLDGEDAVQSGYAEVDGMKITFRESGIYTIDLTIAGTHTGEMTLKYTLLPEDGGENGLKAVHGQGAKVVIYDGKNHAFDPVVTAGDETVLTATDYDLTYSYTPFTDAVAGAAAGTPYDPASTQMSNAGLYVITATAKGNFRGTAVVSFLIRQRNLDDAAVTAEFSETGLIYNGSARTPAVTLKLNGAEITGLAQTEYYSNINAGTAQAVSAAAGGNNNFAGIRVDTFAIGRKAIDDSTIHVASIPPQNYTGKPVAPPLTVTDSEAGVELTLGADYTVSPDNDGTPNTAADALVKGTGNYTGERTVTFVITSEPVDPPVDMFTFTVAPNEWTYGSAPQLTMEVKFGKADLTFGTEYTLTVDGIVYDAQKTLEEAIQAICALKPGPHTILAQGVGTYGTSSAKAEIEIHKAQLPVAIEVTPNTSTGGGSTAIQVTPGAWPTGLDSTKFTTVTVQKNGVDQESLPLVYDTEKGVYQTIGFSFGNETATYTFCLNSDELTGFDPACYEFVITGGTLSVVQSSGGGVVTPTAYTIEAKAGEHGTISPSGKTAVVKGENATFTITPENGYRVANVTVDGKSVGAVLSYTFENVRQNHTISVVFEEGNQTADPEDTGVSDWLNTEDHMAYLEGYPGGIFGADRNMTRAEAAQMFYNLLLDQNVSITVSFEDVEPDAWYAKAVNTLASMGMINGVGGNRYEPERNITRAEFTAIAMRFAKLETGGENRFSDVSKDDWFYEIVVGSIKYGWINGYPDGTFQPNSTITRAEVTAITNRMLGRAADESYVDANRPALRQFSDLKESHWAYYHIMEAANAHTYRKEMGEEDWTKLS